MSAANPTLRPVSSPTWFTGLRSNITCHRRVDDQWFRNAMDERIGSVRVTQAPPVMLERSSVYFVPGSIALYDSDGQRIPESCLSRKPGLHLPGPERIVVSESCRSIGEPMLYLGWVQDHWGHFLTEGISRLWARHVHPQTHGLKSFTTFGYPLAPQVTDYLRWLGLSGTRFTHFDQAVRIDTCFIPAPSFTDRTEAFGAHLLPSREMAELSGFARRRGSSSRPVYLSRARLGFGRKTRREEELEQALSERGVLIVYPEQLSLQQQIALFNTHEVFIGTWGSALHGMSLALEPRRLTVHVLCDGIPGPNYLMFDALLGCATHYVQAMHPTPQQPQQWPDLDLTIEVEAFVEYLQGAGVLARHQGATSAAATDLQLALIGRAWQFCRGDGTVIAPRIRLRRGGEIEPPQHANEHAWRIHQGALEFVNPRGAVSCRFDDVNVADNTMTLQGPFVWKAGVTHVLKEVRSCVRGGPPNDSPRVALLVRTHLVNDKLLDLLDVLNQSRRYDLFVIADETRGPLEPGGYQKISHSTDSCRQFGLSAEHPNILWHCGDYPLYFAAAELIGYDYYGMIEYDVDLVRRSPLFLEGLIARLHESGADFVSEDASPAPASWCWIEAARPVFPVVYSSGIFALVFASARALEFLLQARRREALAGVTDHHIVHCEAFCVSALMSAGYPCATLNSLLDAVVHHSSFHTRSPDNLESDYLLRRYRIEDPRIEIVHPVYDLASYLERRRVSHSRG